MTLKATWTIIILTLVMLSAFAQNVTIPHL